MKGSNKASEYNLSNLFIKVGIYFDFLIFFVNFVNCLEKSNLCSALDHCCFKIDQINLAVSLLRFGEMF